MIEIKFSKIDSNIYKIDTDKELARYHRPFLRSFNFENTTKNIWQNTSNDDKIIELIYDHFRQNEFKIIPNIEIKKIREKFELQKKEYDKFIKLGSELKKNKNPNLPKIELKKGIILKSFQKMPINHMITIPNSANFSIPGSGKTLMTLSSFNILKNQNKIDQMWVIGPLASFKAWETDYENLFDKSIAIHTLRYHASTQTERKKLRNQIKDKDIIITSYGTAINDMDLIKQLWKANNKKILLVLDESHHIKSIEETTMEGNDTTSSKIIQLGKYAERRCILTGTPIPRDLTDLWSQITFLWPHVEPFKELCGGSRREFKNYLKNEFPPSAEEDIKKIIDFMWSRVTNLEMEDEMPERFSKSIEVEMDSTQQQIYSIIKHQATHEIDEGQSQEAVRKLKKAVIIRLLQTVTNPRLISENDPDFQINKLTAKEKGDQDILNLLSEYDGTINTPKIIAAAKHAKELATGIGTHALDNEPKNVLIFTVFKGTADDMAKELQNQNPLVVKGDMDSKTREETYEKFKDWNFSNGSGKILIATIGSVAESVSLHKNKNGKPVCQNVIYLEKNYNAGQYMQSLFRVYRIGSEKKLPIRYYFYESIFDDRITSIDNTIKGVLNTRTDTMFEILNDEFIMTPMSLGKDDGDKIDGSEIDDNEIDDDEIEDEIFQSIISDKDLD